MELSGLIIKKGEYSVMNDFMVAENKIRDDIMSLPPNRRGQLLQWLIEMDKNEWDHELEEDFSGNGPGIALLDRVRKDFQDGTCKRWK